MAGEASAERLIARLGLAAHPEGGWYRETWRGPRQADGRASGTAILYLLAAGGRSDWHRVDAAELWLWHAGAPLTLRLAEDHAGPIEEVLLGADVLAGEAPQRLVPASWWQAAAAGDGWALVSCVVVPGFDFAGFELAATGWAPGE